MKNTKSYISSTAHSYSRLRSGEYDEAATYDKRLKEQDFDLENLGKSVSRLGELSLTISKEIDTQNRILSNLEQEVDQSHDNTTSLMVKTKDYLKQSAEKNSVCTIIVLIVLLLILTILVLYT